MVYMIVGFWPGETISDCLYRHLKLREFGVRPYPMPKTRTRELVGFQRWVVGAYDKRVSWDAWVAAKYQPANLSAPKNNAAAQSENAGKSRNEFAFLHPSAMEAM
jgi:hypothetical protein